MVSWKESQFTPSSQAVSSPPEGGTLVAVPCQVMGEDAGVIVPEGGLAAKLSMAKKAAAEHKMKASKIRGVKRPDSEAGLFCIMIC